jgi:hypothetical protein
MRIQIALVLCSFLFEAAGCHPSLPWFEQQRTCRYERSLSSQRSYYGYWIDGSACRQGTGSSASGSCLSRDMSSSVLAVL